MSLPDRHSLFWKLAAVLALLCLLAVSLHVDLGRIITSKTAHLDAAARHELGEYAVQAEAAWREGGAPGVDRFLERLRSHEHVWAAVVDAQQHSLSSSPLEPAERGKLDFVRDLSWSVGRPGGHPTFYIPFRDSDARLVMELPSRFNPRQHMTAWNLLLQRVIPAALAVLVGVLLYRVLLAPLVTLRRQAQALSAGKLDARIGSPLAQRKDELGELARSFDQMAGRLENMVGFQRQLLRNLSHELRTPLSRLRVTGEREPDIDALRSRLEREVQGMERLIGSTLELVWLDTERPSLEMEVVDVRRLWEMVREDACFESGWSPERLPCDLPPACTVRGNLNGLAQALENIVRNAIRHSPPDGVVQLTGSLEGAYWHLWVDDQGPGVDASKLELIFEPFTRLQAARPGNEGYGLGLSIARSMIGLQGGKIWAENGATGLRMGLRLASV